MNAFNRAYDVYMFLLARSLAKTFLPIKQCLLSSEARGLRMLGFCVFRSSNVQRLPARSHVCPSISDSGYWYLYAHVCLLRSLQPLLPSRPSKARSSRLMDLSASGSACSQNEQDPRHVLGTTTTRSMVACLGSRDLNSCAAFGSASLHEDCNCDLSQSKIIIYTRMLPPKIVYVHGAFGNRTCCTHAFLKGLELAR